MEASWSWGERLAYAALGAVLVAVGLLIVQAGMASTEVHFSTLPLCLVVLCKA